jgi:ADP-ribose pyrophosphatase YjhB (NUDIX family)
LNREYPDAPLVGVAGVVIQGDEVLLIKRKHEPLKGQWSLPGGVLELGETVREGVEREILEETGLRVRALDVVNVMDAIHRERGSVKYHFVLIDFLCEVVSGVMEAATDAHEARWVNRELANSAGDYRLAPATVSVIDKAFAMASGQCS